MENSFATAIALLLNCLVIWVLFNSWKGAIRKHSLILWSTWGLQAITLYIWTLAYGLEFGLVLGLIVPGLIAWSIIVIHTKKQQGAISQSKKKSKPIELNYIESSLGKRALKNIKPLLRNLVLFIIVIPFSATIAIFTTVFFSRLLPWSDLNQIVFSALFLPFMWGCIAYWVCSDSKLLRPFIILLCSGLVSGLSLLYFKL